MNGKTRQMLWGAASLLIMGILFYLSADPADASTAKSAFFTDRFYPLVSAVLTLNQCTFLIRKAAHVSIYALLGICVYQTCRLEARGERGNVWIAVGICFLYACTDELHQLFSSGRSGQFDDVLLDSIGALLGILLLRCLQSVFRRHRKRRQAHD